MTDDDIQRAARHALRQRLRLTLSDAVTVALSYARSETDPSVAAAVPNDRETLQEMAREIIDGPDFP